MKPMAPVPDAIYDILVRKRDEHKALADAGRSPLGRNPSKNRVLDYALQLMNWMEESEDPDIKTVLSNFEYRPLVKPQGRPYSFKTDLNKISPQQMSIMLKKFAGMGINNPTDEQLVGMFKEADLLDEPIGGDRIKASKNARKKIEQSNKDTSLTKLDEETRKRLPVKNEKGEEWFEEKVKWTPPS